MDSTVAAACILLAILAIALVALAARRSRRDHFYTLYAREEPTRSYVPYVGTIAKGVWGGNGLPWAEGTEGPSGGVGARAFVGPLDNAGAADVDPAALAEARSLVVSRLD
ncbi:MAG: hypothetical protein WC700_07740 [Gemmatimonadaceae bacterium]|jgi:hypothetical protein